MDNLSINIDTERKTYSASTNQNNFETISTTLLYDIDYSTLDTSETDSINGNEIIVSYSDTGAEVSQDINNDEVSSDLPSFGATERLVSAYEKIGFSREVASAYVATLPGSEIDAKATAMEQSIEIIESTPIGLTNQTQTLDSMLPEQRVKHQQMLAPELYEFSNTYEANQAAQAEQLREDIYMDIDNKIEEYVELMSLSFLTEAEKMNYLANSEDFKNYLAYNGVYDLEYLENAGYLNDYFAQEVSSEIILPDFMRADLDAIDAEIDAIDSQIEAKEAQKSDNLSEYWNWYSTFYDDHGNLKQTPEFLELWLFEKIHGVSWHTKRNEITRLHNENVTLVNEINDLEKDKREAESRREQTEAQYKQFAYSMLTSNSDFEEYSGKPANMPFDITYLTQKEKDILTYVYNKYGENTAKDFYSSLEENIKVAEGYSAALDAMSGLFKTDENGNIIYQKDANGNYVLDAYGNKIPEFDASIWITDANGNPEYIYIDGKPYPKLDLTKLKDEFLSLGYGTGAGIESFWNGITHSYLNKDYDMTVEDYKKYIITQLLFSIDGNNKTIYDFGTAVGNMVIPYGLMLATSVVTTAISPSSTVTTVLPSFVYTLASFSSSYGNNIGKALEMGMDMDSACIYSVLTSGSESALELLIGGIPGAKPVSGWKAFFNSAIDEASEETIQYFSNVMIDSFTTGRFEFDAEELIKNSAYAAILALPMSGGSIVVNNTTITLREFATAKTNDIRDALIYKAKEIQGEKVNYDALSPESQEIVDSITITENSNANTDVAATSFVDNLSDTDFETFKTDFKNYSLEEQFRVLNNMSNETRIQQLVETLSIQNIKYIVNNQLTNPVATQAVLNKLNDIVLNDEQIHSLYVEAQKKGYLGTFETYRDHTFGHVKEVAIHAYHDAQVLSEVIKANNLDEYSSKISAFDIYIAGLLHDTGMAGGMNVTYDEDGKITSNYDPDSTDGGQVRSNHSANSALNALIMRDTLIEMGCDPNIIALLTFSHSKSNSGISHLTSPEDWSVCINKIESMIEEHNKHASSSEKIIFKDKNGKEISFVDSLVESGILIDNSSEVEIGRRSVKPGKITNVEREAFKKLDGMTDAEIDEEIAKHKAAGTNMSVPYEYRNYNLNEEQLSVLSSEAFVLRTGDAHTNNKGIGLNQAQQTLVITDLITNEVAVNELLNGTYKDKKARYSSKGIEDLAKEESAEVKIMIGENPAKGNHFVVGESFVDFDSSAKTITYTNESGQQVTQTKFIAEMKVDENNFPYSTLFAMNERIGEYNTAERLPIAVEIQLSESIKGTPQESIYIDYINNLCNNNYPGSRIVYY